MTIEVFFALAFILLLFIAFKLATKFKNKSREINTRTRLTTIAIIDSHELFRKGLGMVLSEQGFHILFEMSEVTHITHLIETNGKPDIALISLNLKGINGIETVKWLQKFQPEIKILVTYIDPIQERPEKVAEAGAHGYISKTADPEEFKTAVLAVLNKGIYRPQRTYANRAFDNFTFTG